MSATVITCAQGHRFDAAASQSCPACELVAPTFLPPAAEKKASAFGFESMVVKLSEGGRPTRMLARFEPVAELASGGMGKLFLAREKATGRRVALKVMHAHLLEDASMVQQFAREALVTARLEHPNVIPVYDVGFLEGDELYYAMRFIRGKTFAAAVHLSLGERLRVLRDAARATAFAHANGLWHRDLKPENILVGEHGDTYVIDWGLVTLVRGMRFELGVDRLVVNNTPLALELEQALEDTKQAITGAGAVLCGTPSYMAPEQARAQDELMGPASDAWAFGVMLYEVLASAHPYLGQQRDASLQMAVGSLFSWLQKRQAPSTLSQRPMAPALDELCMALLDPSPASRATLPQFISEVARFSAA